MIVILLLLTPMHGAQTSMLSVIITKLYSLFAAVSRMRCCQSTSWTWCCDLERPVWNLGDIEMVYYLLNWENFGCHWLVTSWILRHSFIPHISGKFDLLRKKCMDCMICLFHYYPCLINFQQLKHVEPLFLRLYNGHSKICRQHVFG